MIEIIVDGKTARENLFDSYYKKYSNSIITPKNNEIRKYCEFLVSYYTNNAKELNYLDDFFVMEMVDKEKFKKSQFSLIEEDESFLFQFPDDYPEEEAFYFKLKYC